MSTVPVTVIVSPPSAVAPASIYAWYCSTLTGLSPVIVIVGPVVSSTTTVLVAVEVLPEASVAV